MRIIMFKSFQFIYMMLLQKLIIFDNENYIYLQLSVLSLIIK